MTLALLRNRPQIPLISTLLGDLFALFCAWVATRTLGYVEGMRVVLLSFLGCYLVAQFATGLSSSLRTVSFGELVSRVFWAWLHTVLGVAGLRLLLPNSMADETILVLSAFALPCLLAVRLGAMGLRHSVRRRGRNLRWVLVAGTGQEAQRVAGAVAGNPAWGYRVAGFLRGDEAPFGLDPDDPPLLGHFRDLAQIVKTHVVDEILVAAPQARVEAIDDLIAVAQSMGLRTHMIANFIAGNWRSVEAQKLDGHLLLTLTPFPDDQVRLLIKRLVDIVGAALLLLLTAPVMLVIAILVKTTSRGAVLFVQERAGLNGRLFNLYKFRTMVENAEQSRLALLGKNEMTGPVFKMRADPRITNLGRALRRFSFDELPQLWNVIKGEMSLVGPRPLMPHEVAGYETWHRRRMSMRPGITCLWQIGGRNHIDFQRWMELDLEYIDRWSLRLDLKILARTVPAILTGIGAS